MDSVNINSYITTLIELTNKGSSRIKLSDLEKDYVFYTLDFFYIKYEEVNNCILASFKNARQNYSIKKHVTTLKDLVNGHKVTLSDDLWDKRNNELIIHSLDCFKIKYTISNNLIFVEGVD